SRGGLPAPNSAHVRGAHPNRGNGRDHLRNHISDCPKMVQGHRGANHPVKDDINNKVEITSMNHGFMVDRDSLPAGVEETHTSLFDGTLCGIKMTDRPVFSVQHHPEASPGPQDSFYLFQTFMDTMAKDDALAS
ncbi:MAG: hypothetical protein AAF562_07710, partial [Pseudomonadota bacterium]